MQIFDNPTGSDMTIHRQISQTWKVECRVGLSHMTSIATKASVEAELDLVKAAIKSEVSSQISRATGYTEGQELSETTSVDMTLKPGEHLELR